MSGFAFTIGERRVVGEVDRTAAARARFERAIVDGEAVVVVGLGLVGLEHVGRANVSSEGARRVGGRSGEEPVKAVNA
mgnify:CR=1 FL=1